MYRDGIKVYRTLDIKETCYFIQRFLEKFIKDGTKNISLLLPNQQLLQENPNINYIDVKKVKKKNNLTPEVFNQLVLLQIPGVSNNIVERIFQDYTSIKHILDSYYQIDKLDIDTDKKTKQKKNQEPLKTL